MECRRGRFRSHPNSPTKKSAPRGDGLRGGSEWMPQTSGWLAANHADEYSKLASLPQEAVASMSRPRQYDSSNHGLTKANASKATIRRVSVSSVQWLRQPCREHRPDRIASPGKHDEPQARGTLRPGRRGTENRHPK